MPAADFGTIGAHGIGRFAQEVLTRCKLTPIIVNKSPASPAYAYYLARALGRERSLDLFFSPSYIPPLWSRKKFIFTIHDLNHIDRTENSGFLKRQFYRFVIKPGCWRAARVLTVSEFSRQRILAWSGLPEARVLNVGNGVDEIYCAVGDKFSPGFPYLLCVSNRRGHKNETRLLQAFARAPISSDVRLILTGNATPVLQALADSLGISSRLIFSGMVPERDLPALYRGAIALVFPSLYEGFGLPVVEAMACGTPVITSDITSLPEVAGEAALLVDPTSTSEFAVAMATIVTDEDIRQRLAAAGLQRARIFSWAKVAERVQAAFDETT